MDLFKPASKREYILIKQSGFKKFPKRLPKQTILHFVLNENYATEIASKWKSKDEESYVLHFLIDDEYIKNFRIHTVGKDYHKEFWIPAGELPEFNDNIIGLISFVKLI